MAHLIDNSKGFNAFVSAAPAWHGLGQIMENVTLADALQKGGLDYEVLKVPNVHVLPNMAEVISDNSFFTVRTDVNKVLGDKLGKDYTVMQNREALEIVEEVLQSGTATIETAGAIDEGRKAFVCLKLHKDLLIKSDDAIKQYVLFATSHDGSMSITAMPTNVRVVCNNTLHAALSGKSGKIRIRHSANAQENLREAARVLKLIETGSAANAEKYEEMSRFKITPETMFDYFGNIFCTPEEIKELQNGGNARKILSTRKQNELSKCVHFATQGQGQNITLESGNLTMWTAYNAATGILSRKKFTSYDDRANSMLFGTVAEKIEKSHALAIAPESIKSLRKSGNFFSNN